MRRFAVFMRILNAALALCLILVFTAFSGLTQGERLAHRALRYIDVPYALGAKGPSRFDCSGLILRCAAQEGITGLPHSAERLARAGRPVSQSRLLPGDILCFDTVRDRDPSDHVGIYIGGNRFVHASSASGKVTVSALEGYYLERCTGARRVASAYF